MFNQTEDDSTLRYVNCYINLFYLLFGNMGNLFKVAFFLQKPLRSLPCTVYILFATASDCVTLNNLPARQLLSSLYPEYHWIQITVDWSNYRNGTVLASHSVSTYDIIACKLRSYLHLFNTDLSLQMLLFASINRFYSIHRRTHRVSNNSGFERHFCNQPHILRLCIISSLICACFSLQHVFNFTIYFALEGCVPSNRTLWAVWTVSIHCFLLPVPMTIFGLLTLRNIRDNRTFRQPMVRSQRRTRHDRFHRQYIPRFRTRYCIRTRIERQLTLVIIGEIFVTIVTSIPHGVYTYHYLLHGIQTRTIGEGNRTKWMTLFIRITMYFEPSCGFYIYLLSLSALRKRFKKLVTNKLAAIRSCWSK